MHKSLQRVRRLAFSMLSGLCSQVVCMADDHNPFTWQTIAECEVCQLQDFRPRNAEFGTECCLLGQHSWVGWQHPVW